MKMKLFFIAALIIFCSSCTKSSIEATTTSNNPQGTLMEAGYGSSNLPFATASWKLPANVKLEDSIHDYSYCWAFSPHTNIAQKDWKGVPLGFTFCLTLKNTDPGNTTIIHFPPQLLFASSSLQYQNVLLINIGSVSLSPGADKTIVVMGFCVNKGRHPPQAFDDATGNFLSYDLGPSVIPSALQEVVDIVRTKNITINDVLKPDGTVDADKVVKYSVIQKAIWEVTDEQGLTVVTKAQLLAL